jgi:hypothetical protein
MKKVTVALIAASILVGSLYAGTNEMDHSKMMNQKGMMNQSECEVMHEKMHSSSDLSASTFDKHQDIINPEYRGVENYGI